MSLLPTIFRTRWWSGGAVGPPVSGRLVGIRLGGKIARLPGPGHASRAHHDF